MFLLMFPALFSDEEVVDVDVDDDDDDDDDSIEEDILASRLKILSISF